MMPDGLPHAPRFFVTLPAVLKAMVRPLCLLLLGALLLTACRKTVSAPEAERLQMQGKALRDSADAVWATMITSDDAKIDNVGRLLQELSYNDSVNVIRLAGLRDRHQQLRERRYDQLSMGDGAAIDHYDAATDTLLRAAYQLAAATPGFDGYVVGVQLVREVQAADDSMIHYRIRYDDRAAAYNAFLRDHGSKLAALGEPYASWTPLPLFTIEP